MAKKLSTNTLIKYLIWVYLALLIFDGALRKWFLPQLSDVLLVSRVPVTLLIYMLALQSRSFVINGWVAGAVFFTMITVPLSLLTHGNMVVTAFGVIANFLSIPLIFIIPKVMDYYDVEKMGRALIILVIPMTVIISLQFYSPQSAWINRSVGGIEGAGFTGALGRYRPPGTFSFITGVAQFFTLAFAFFLAQFINHRTLPLWLLIPTGVAFVMAIYGSISRLLAVSIIIVFVFAAVGLMLSGKKLNNFFKVGIAVVVFFAIASQFTYFQDGMEAFTTRWEVAKGGEEETATAGFMERFYGGMVQPLISYDFTNLLGLGLGAGTNVGARFLTGQRDFLAGEGEFWRLKNELGTLFGSLLIFYRIGLTVVIGIAAYKALKKMGNILPWLIFSSCFLLISSGQWSQQTTLGFAILSGGLVMGGCIIRKNASPGKKSVHAKDSKAVVKKTIEPATSGPIMS